MRIIKWRCVWGYQILARAILEFIHVWRRTRWGVLMPPYDYLVSFKFQRPSTWDFDIHKLLLINKWDMKMCRNYSLSTLGKQKKWSNSIIVSVKSILMSQFFLFHTLIYLSNLFVFLWYRNKNSHDIHVDHAIANNNHDKEDNNTTNNNTAR